MSFATGFNSGGSSAFPLAIVNTGVVGTDPARSDIAHDPRANRGGAGGLLKATTLLTRNVGRTVPIYNSLPDQWYGAGVNSPDGVGVNTSLINRFTGSVTMTAAGSVAATVFGVPLAAQTAAKTAYDLTVLPTIPWTYLTFVSGAAGTGGWFLDMTKVRIQYTAVATAAATDASSNNSLPAGTLAITGGVLPAGLANSPYLPGLLFVQTGGAPNTINWQLDLLPPSIWGAGFIGLNGSVSTQAANFLNP